MDDIKWDEHPVAGPEWVTKALLLGAVIDTDPGHAGFALWAVRMPDSGKRYFGVTQARACRKLVRAITGVEG